MPCVAADLAAGGAWQHSGWYARYPSFPAGLRLVLDDTRRYWQGVPAGLALAQRASGPRPGRRRYAILFGDLVQTCVVCAALRVAGFRFCSVGRSATRTPPLLDSGTTAGRLPKVLAHGLPIAISRRRTPFSGDRRPAAGVSILSGRRPARDDKGAGSCPSTLGAVVLPLSLGLLGCRRISGRGRCSACSLRKNQRMVPRRVSSWSGTW